jgi:V/A-type H+-transporting ATPase subunit K
MMKIKIVFILGFLLLCASLFVSSANAADEAAAGSNKGLIAVGMGLAVGLGALGTGVAQARIGAAGLGSAVEKPESLGLALIFFLLPETLVIFGLVIAFILLGKM